MIGSHLSISRLGMIQQLLFWKRNPVSWAEEVLKGTGARDTKTNEAAKEKQRLIRQRQCGWKVGVGEEFKNESGIVR